jgi:hypothetical protein
MRPLATFAAPILLGLVLSSQAYAQRCELRPGVVDRPKCVRLSPKRVLCTGTARMSCDPSSSHIRSAEIRVPVAVEPRPSVVATPFTDEGPGNPFAVYRIEVNDLGTETQVAISAANIEVGTPVPYEYRCSYTITGRPR